MRKLYLLLTLVFISLGANAQVSGTVFRDFNANGLRGTAVPNLEPGISGIIVNAYDASNTLIASFSSTANGTYSIPVSGAVYTGTQGSNTGFVGAGIPVRIEFVIPNSGTCSDSLDNSSIATANGSSIQFVTGGATAINYAINNSEDYVSNTNPDIFIPQFINGNPQVAGTSQTNTWFKGFPYNTTATTASPQTLNGATIGSVWGVAYSKQAKKIFTAAFLKRHCGLGTLGTGGIYILTPTATSFTASTFYDLDLNGHRTRAASGTYGAASSYNLVGSSSITFLGATDPLTGQPNGLGVVGSNVARGLAASATTPNNDPAVFDQTGKVGLGDIEISEDGKFLFVMNLYSKLLFRLELNDAYNPTSVIAVTSYALPATTVTNGEMRPFAVKYSKGKVFVGAITSGENGGVNVQGGTTDMFAYVFELNNAKGTATFSTLPVLKYPLNHAKGESWDFNPASNSKWLPWSKTTTLPFGGATNKTYPTPLLTNIEFSDNGAMILDFCDRSGHQYGNWNYRDLSGTTLASIFVGGDIVIAGKNCTTGAYAIESNGSYTSQGTTYSSTGVGNGTGLATINAAGTGYTGTAGEFFEYDDAQIQGDNNDHAECMQGGAAVLRGDAKVMTTNMDPIIFNTGGTTKQSTTNGVATSAYQMYLSSGSSIDAFFNKGNGLGDIEMTGDIQPIQIGNRVWSDANSNGIQDANETVGNAGLTVTLHSPGIDGNYGNGDDQTWTTTTNANGNYLFSTLTSADNRKPATWTSIGSTILPGYNYRLEIAVPVSATITTADASSNSLDLIDNDATLIGANAVIDFNTSNTNHNFDFGFVFTCGTEPTTTAVYTPATCALLIPNNDASLVINTTGDKVAISTTGIPTTTYAAASAVTLGSVTFTAQNGTVDSFYVRVFNSANCFYDTIIVVTPVKCCPSIAAITTPANYANLCSGSTIPAFNVLTNAIATDSIRLVSFTSQQTNASTIYNGGTLLATKVITGVATTVTNTANFTLVPLPTNLGPGIDTLWIYAIYIDKTGDTTCKVFAEKPVRILPKPSFSFNYTQATCSATSITPLNTATVQIFTTGDKVAISPTGTPTTTYALATTVTAGSATLTAQNGATDTFYVRIFNTAACFFDTVIAVTPIRCCPAITFGTPANGAAFCSGATIPSLIASTNAKSPDQIRYYLYNTQQSTYNDIVNGGGTVLGTANIVGVAATVNNTATLTNAVLPVNLYNTQTIYIYAVYVDASTDTTCKIFVEKPITLNAKPTANISGLHFSCNSSAVTLTSDAATTYKWGKSPSATQLSTAQANTFTPTINTTSTYWLVVTNAGTCVSDTVFHTLTTSTGVTGFVFRDFNSNGIQETTETNGVSNVKVRAYNASGVILDSMLTDVNGQYFFSSITPAMGKVRIEFVKSTLPAGYLESFVGTDNGSDLQFVTAPNCNVNWGVKIDGDYCQANPTIALSRYVNGASSNNENMIARFNYNDINTSPTPGSFAKANEIGSVWGLAYNKKRKEMYSGTFLKRHVGIKDYDNDGNPDLGVIWKTSNLSVTTPTNSVWVDLTKAPYNLDFGKIGTDASRGLGARTAPSNDPTTFPLIGKIGFGDIDISEDGSSLWAVNPKANQLYKIAINTDGTPGALSTFNIPNIGSGNYDTLFVKAGGTLNGSLVNSYIGDEYYKGGTVITNTTQAGSSFSTARTGASFDYLISLPNGTYDVLLSFGNNATARDQKNTIGGVVQNLTIPASTSSTQLFSSITITDDRLDIKIEDNPGGTSTAAILSGIKIWSNSNIPFEDRSYPFALKYKNGNVYVGTTYGAELTQNKDSLRSSIFKLEDNGSTVFTPVINIPLNYKKGPPTPGEPILQTRWQAWTGAMDKGSYNLTVFTHIYVQPILSDIEFIDDGDMVLGFFDRYGHQTGDYNYPTMGTSVVRTCSGGDILRADFFNGTYTLENNGTVGNNSSASGINNQEGPGNGEFYAGDILSGAHNETSYGGLMFLPGTNEIGLSILDPISFVSSGVKYLSNTTGSSVRNYQVTGSNFSVDYFSKANALGDLELLCNEAPLQIGNYVWIDLNSNGVQDPNESPIPNVAVTLWKAGTQIATATTNANGEYYFSAKAILGVAWTGTGADTTLLPNTAYEVRILMSQTNIATPNYSLTTTNSVISNGNDQNDNDATINSGYATIPFTTGEAGTINHTYDFGFLCTVPNVSYAYTPATCPANLILASNNASLLITTNGNKIAMSTTGIPVTTYAAASTITGGTFTFTAQNGTTDSFFVRVWNGDGCFKDTLIVVQPIRCCPSIAAITTPVSYANLCSGSTIPAFNVLTNAIATDTIRLVYFTTQQTNASTIYNSGTFMTQKVIVGSATTVTNTANFTLVPLPTNLGTGIDTIWIYAIYIDKTGDVTCKVFAEKPIRILPRPTFSFNYTGATCPATGIIPNNTATVQVFTTGDKVAISATGTPTTTYASATAVTAGSATLINQNGATDTFYIRFFNTASCFFDTVIAVTPSICCPAFANTTVPADNATYCSGGTIAAYNVSTNAIAPDSVRLVYFNTQQTDPNVIYAGPTLAQKVIVGVANSVSNDANFTNLILPSISGSASDTIWIYAIYIDNNGDISCKPFEEKPIILNPEPTQIIYGNDYICNGGSVTLTTNGAVTYQWGSVVPPSSTLGTTQSITVNPAATTTYWVKGTNPIFACASDTAYFTVTPAPGIYGSVFYDFNSNGIKDANESNGVSGISVKAYDSTGVLLATVTTNNLGRYHLASITPAMGKVRVEFDKTTYPAGFNSSFVGTDNGSDVQFVTATECSADLGLFTSSQYCQINPNFALVRFERNTAAAANTTISMMGYNANTQNFLPLSASDASYTWGMPSLSGGFPGNFPVAAQTTLSTVGNTGSTFGLTYDNKNNLLFTSAYMRAFAPMKANASSNSFGEGVIYSIPVNGSTVGTPTPWLDLETLLGDGVAGIFIPDGAYPTSQTLFGQTGLNPNKIGYTGLGGMQMSANGAQLYVVNLAGKEVLVIPVGVGGTAPTVATAIKRFPLPTTDVSGTYPDGRSIATVLGLGVHPITGRVYATLTKTGPTVNDLRGYVYSFDPNDNTPSAADYTKELEIPMNIVRPSTNVNVAQFYDEVNHPWEAVTASAIFYNNNGDNFSQHTQPWLGEIAFDLQVDGTYGMTIAERNRYHDIIHSSYYVAGGLLYKASLNGSTWTLENNGVVTPASTSVNWTNNTVNTAGSNSSPTNRFYRNAGVEGTYSAGTIGHIQGSNEVMTPALDNIFHSAGSGVAWLSTVNGNRIKDNHLYGNNTLAGYYAVPFTKSNNWGDIEPLCEEAPLQIGNYVWFDADQDGVQDPNETPLNNTTVTLWKAGTQIASTVTNVKGEYYFSTKSVLGAAWTGTGADTTLLPATAYEVRILMSQSSISTPNYSITQANSTTNSGNDQNDNDATLNTGFAVISLITGEVGSINHTYDFGFTTTLPFGSIGNYVWTDANANGSNDEPSTAGINGVMVYLYDNTNPSTPIDSMLTANNGSSNPGYYLFDSLASGTYFVKFPTTTSGNILTTQTSTAQTDNNSDANPTTGISPLVVINATGTGQDKNNTTIDAGYKTCTTSSSTTLTACNAYTWAVNGNTYTTSGTYTATSLNANSCLHTDSLVLTVNYSTTSTSSVAACNTYTWSVNNVTYTTSGTYTATSLNAGGCVQTNTLVLTINNSTSSSTPITACNTYTWSINNVTYTTSGTYTVTSLNANACTHTDSLVLSIIPNGGIKTTITACDAYTWPSNNVTYTISGTHTNPSGPCGADTLVLTINTSTTSTSSVTACGSYTWNANNVTYTNSGTYTATSLNAAGCLHTNELILTINPPPIADAGQDINLSCTTPSGTIGTVAIGANTYLWSPSSGLSAANIAQPIANPIVTTSYTVTVTGSNGCTKTDVVVVNVNPNKGSIGNYVWYDADGNGLNNEAAAQGLNGVTVELYKETSSGSGIFTIIGTTSTANNLSGDPGYYHFEICESANYKVKFPVLNGANALTIETSTLQTDNNSDANILDGFSPMFAINILGIGLNKDNNTIDAGYSPPVGSIGNYVWTDANHDGINGESSTAGINGVKVYLYGAGADNAVGGGDDILLDSVNTANNSSGNPGYYLFPGLPSGNYFIDFPTSVSGKNLTIQTTTSQTDNNSDANLVNGNSPLVIINATGFGQDKNNTTIDAGYYTPFPCQTPNCRTLSSKTIIN